MPANNASSSKKTTAELEAELAAFDEQGRATEAKRKLEQEERKWRLAQLVEAKKAEEEEAVVEATQKAAAEAMCAGKHKAIETSMEEDRDTTPKKRKTDDEDGAVEQACSAC